MESHGVGVADAVARLHERVEAASLRSGRPPGGVTLMAAVKTRSIQEILSVLQAGITTLGENRVQEGLSHLEQLADVPRSSFRMHFIGRLQTNKAKKALQAFDSIDGVDSDRLAETLSSLTEASGRVREVMLEVNLGEESQKGGIEPGAAEALADRVYRLPGLTLTGLMGVSPYDPEPEASRPFYRRLSALFSRMRRAHPDPGAFRHLSMGMSHDFEVAVEEGATLIRVGQALFGPRRTP